MTSSRRAARFCPGGAGPPTQELMAYIDRHRDAYGAEPICKVLQIVPSSYRRHAAQVRNPALRCERAKHDKQLITDIQRVGRGDQALRAGFHEGHEASVVWCGLNASRCAQAEAALELTRYRLAEE